MTVVTMPRTRDALAQRFQAAKQAYSRAVERALADPSPAVQRELDEALQALNAARAACEERRRG